MTDRKPIPPPTLEESRRLLREFADSVAFVPPLPEGAPLPPDPDPDDEEDTWPGGIEDIPNEFQTPERLRHEDGKPLRPDERDEG
jgi:hypothetical protein